MSDAAFGSLESADPWRLATFNVRTATARDGRRPWAARRSSVVSLIGRLRADVLGLQEANEAQLETILRARDEFAAIGSGRDDGKTRGEQCPILVRRERGTIAAHRTRWFSDTPDRPGSRLPRAGHPRIATVARVETRVGTVQVANTHLDHQHEQNRLRSVDLLLGWLGCDLPTVILGDLNVTPEDPVVGALRAGGFTPCLAPPGEGTHHRFTGSADGRQIDHVLVSAHWEVLGCEVVRTGPGDVLPSDHWPLVAVVRLR